MQKAWGGAWIGYFPLGGFLTSSPAVSSWGENRLDVVARGGDNALYHKWWNGMAWSEYERLGGSLEGAPAAISRGPNLIDAFFRGRDDHLYQIRMTARRGCPRSTSAAGCTLILPCPRGDAPA